MTGREAAQKVAALVGNVTADEIMGRCRLYNIAVARQITMWYMVRVLGMGWTEAGKELNRGHATVIYGVRQAEIVIERNRSYDRRFHDAAMQLQREYKELIDQGGCDI